MVGPRAATEAAMTPFSPLTDTAADDGDDIALVRRIEAGDREALEALLGRHQPWIYNIAVRMVYDPHDAEDATQEVLIKVLTKLSTFEGRSRFRTWLYRIVVNHVLNMKRARAEEGEWTFRKYGDGLDNAPDAELPDPSTVPVDLQLLVDESRITCSSGMLLCLSRDQRLAYILGEIFGASDAVGAELLETTRDNFRQKLARARRDLHNFMHDKCGLVNTANPCRCARKTQVFMAAGFVNPANLLFARPHLRRVRDMAPRVHEAIDALDAAYAEIHRAHPFLPPPDVAAVIRALLEQPHYRSLLDPEWKGRSS
jgi:RNA polymerase sigma factor (sigma-70 family)